MKRLDRTERILILGVVLLAWALRWVALMDVPPGWRDDDLVEVYTMSNEILTSGVKLYYAEAWGQGPLYHTIRAPVLAFGGVNQASVRWLSATFGLLAVLLTWATGRRLFSKRVGILAGALSSVSFWSLMYSRVAIRHIGALPWMILAIYWGWRLLREDRHTTLAFAGMALGTAGAMLTYYAGRLVPVVLIGVLITVASTKQQKKRFIFALVLGLLLTAPTFITAYFTPGADARVSELAYPIQALLSGDSKPLLQNIWLTLGMFHAHGDPEWLYNIPFRPLFGTICFFAFISSILYQVAHHRNSNSRLTLLWLVIGLSPAFISHPESSFGHTILAQPVTMILLAASITMFPKNWSRALLPVSVAIFALVAGRDIVDYFIKWPRYSMVNFLYRGDYRQVTRYLDTHPALSESAVGTMLFGQWDKVAVETDIHRQDALVRWVNPDRALINSATGELVHFLQEESQPILYIQNILNISPAVDAPEGLQGYAVSLPDPGSNAIRGDEYGTPLYDLIFNESMVLEAIQPYQQGGGELWIVTWWRVAGTLPLPPEKLYPPPYGVYGGPRLAVFAHILKHGEYVTGDDGLWVDPYSLRTGDNLMQVHRFEIEENELQGIDLVMGLYDPQTGVRWQTAAGSDMIVINLEP